MTALRLLVTGVTGQVGYELCRTLAPLGLVIAADRASADLGDPDGLRRAVCAARPDLIVNAAAYTAVDLAESEADVAMAVNATAPAVLADEARRLDAALIHFSTDYVFGGGASTPYAEDDPTAPTGVYGRSKRLGEEAVTAARGRHLILRTSWVYGGRGRNFLLTMRRLAQEREELRVVDDQVGAPTWSRMIAEATAAIVSRSLAAPALFADVSGTYHLTAQGSTTWCGFARAILDAAPALGLSRVPRLVPIRTAEYPTAASRPAYSVLSGEKLRRVFGVSLPPWSEQLALCIADMTR